MSLTLTNIPQIMQHHGWTNGVALMNKWFNRLGATAPNYSEPPDSITIRMSWTLGFPRARRVYDQLVLDRIWANQPAQQEIARMLRRYGYLDGGQHSFGNLAFQASSLDPDYINQRAVSYGVTDLDDLTAALGNFNLRVLVAGSVRPSTPPQRPGHYVTINEVGVYVRDSYDFNGDQFLGYWNDADNSVSLTNPAVGTRVTNKDFRDHRTRTGSGGDFLVFSDIKRTQLTNPDSFIIP